MPELINARRALELLTDVVAGREDYTYPDIYDVCRYVVDGQPSCVVGHVLHRAGWTIDELEYMDDPATIVVAGILDQYEPDRVTARAATILAEAQLTQDARNTWGESLKDARNAYELYEGEEDV